MSDLLVDTTLLRDMASDVSLIRTEFDSAKTTSRNLADAVGHAGLADRVTTFASNWDHRRGELVEQLATLGENLLTAADGLENTDTELGACITDAAQPAAGANG
ncbi:hypothetical protein [Cryobacterium roopkundense]|uniref:WXG100 family type VII secretion target n=1 Tax=Cryobacterium roopkundense TaxID=1001240 RepID=A0A7W9E1G4_9MICO|nr:hypothetical protein [Cryobacterium roopkundense]MBB5639487.1 hypothetical protein [Cryobacterium roopkundense]